jgi:hypothetical protein
MHSSFHIHVLSAAADLYCEEYSEEGVHIAGPMNVRRGKVVVVELNRAVASSVLAPLITRSLSPCEITRVRLFDEQIPFTLEQLQKVLNKQSKLGL